MKIVLSVKQQGPVPSFKNNKRVVGKKVFTDKKTKRWMEDCIQNLGSQLFCITQIGSGETPTAPIPHSSIASSLPLDDSWEWIPEQHLYAQLVKPGEEGATIIIEKI
jgi:hypothetical protein